MSAAVTREGKIQLMKLARIDHQLAQLASAQARLLAERAQVFDGMATEDREVTTGKKERTPHRPIIGPVSEVDRQRAIKALQGTGHVVKVNR